MSILRKIRYVLPIATLFLGLLYGMYVVYTVDFPSLGRNPAFYPLSLIVQGPPNEFLLPAVIAMFIIVMLVIGSPNHWAVVAISLIISLCGLASGMTLSLLSSRISHQDSVLVENKTYHLIQVFGGERWGYSSPIAAYTILECDQFGLFCHYFSTPYLKDDLFEEFEQGGRLILSETNQVDLIVNDVIYNSENDVVYSR